MLKNLLFLFLIFGVLFFVSMSMYKKKLLKQDQLLKISKISNINAKSAKNTNKLSKSKDSRGNKKKSIRELAPDSDLLSEENTTGIESESLDSMDITDEGAVDLFDDYPVLDITGSELDQVNSIMTFNKATVTSMHEKNMLYRKARKKFAALRAEKEKLQNQAKSDDPSSDILQTGQ